MKALHHRCAQQTSTLRSSIHTPHTHTSAHRFSLSFTHTHTTVANQESCRRHQVITWSGHSHHLAYLAFSYSLPTPFVFAIIRSQRHWFQSAPLGLKHAYKLHPNRTFKRHNIVWWKKKDGQLNLQFQL